MKIKRIAACVLVFAMASGTFSVKASEEDADIPAKIQWMQAVGFLRGDSDGNLNLDKEITRAETAALLMRALGEKASGDSAAFSDVKNHWAKDYIGGAAKLGILNGYPDGTFKPDNTVLYEELLKMLITALGTESDLTYPDGYISEAAKTGLSDGVAAKAGQALNRGAAAKLFLNAFDMTVSDTNKTMRETYLEFAESADSAEPSEYGAPALSGEPESFVSDEAHISYDADVGAAAPEYIPEVLPDEIHGGSSGSGGGSGVSHEGASWSYTAPSGGHGSQVIPPPEAGQLTAGRWDDNDNYDFWLKLMEDHNYGTYSGRWGIPSKRCPVTVLTENGQPAWDVSVILKNGQENVIWQSKTDREGKAYVFINPQDHSAEEKLSLTAQAENGGTSEEVKITLNTESAELRIPAQSEPEALDIMLMVDTTGSMSDELSYLQAELKDVVRSIGIPARVSCNFYRDFGDAYIVRPYPFETDIDIAAEQISRQRASGGGDYEEAVDLALIDGIAQHEWSESAKARLLFLVLDAPAHFNKRTAANIQAMAAAASEKGIRVIPVSSSGVNKSTEFFLRTLALTTNGTYLFLTDDSGIGGSHIEPTIGDYTAEYLNNLMISVIKEYAGEK